MGEKKTVYAEIDEPVPATREYVPFPSYIQ